MLLLQAAPSIIFMDNPVFECGVFHDTIYTCLEVPEIMKQLLPAARVEGKSEPASAADTKHEWYNGSVP